MAGQVAELKINNKGGKPQRVVIEGGGNYVSEFAVQAAVAELFRRAGLSEISDILTRATAQMHPDAQQALVTAGCQREAVRRGLLTEGEIAKGITYTQQMAIDAKDREVIEFLEATGALARNGGE